MYLTKSTNVVSGGRAVIKQLLEIDFEFIPIWENKSLFIDDALNTKSRWRNST